MKLIESAEQSLLQTKETPQKLGIITEQPNFTSFIRHCSSEARKKNAQKSKASLPDHKFTNIRFFRRSMIRSQHMYNMLASTTRKISVVTYYKEKSHIARAVVKNVKTLMQLLKKATNTRQVFLEL